MELVSQLVIVCFVVSNIVQVQQLFPYDRKCSGFIVLICSQRPTDQLQPATIASPNRSSQDILKG
jgi:hypothetical protein